MNLMPKAIDISGLKTRDLTIITAVLDQEEAELMEAASSHRRSVKDDTKLKSLRITRSKLLKRVGTISEKEFAMVEATLQKHKSRVEEIIASPEPGDFTFRKEAPQYIQQMQSGLEALKALWELSEAKEEMRANRDA
jgi:hypothetical protein